MTQRLTHKSISRRAFLAGAGLVAVAGAMPTAWLAARELPWFRRPLELRAALLIPKTPAYPRLGEQLGMGLKAARHRLIQTLSVQDVMIGVGYGDALRQARALLEQGAADVILAVVNTRVAERLRPVFEGQGRPLIVLDSGANAIAASAGSPSVIVHSLGAWQAAYATGRWLVEQHGPRVALAASLFDSGFDQISAARQGVADAGGAIVGTELTHFDPANPGLPRALDAISAARPDGVFALYTGQGAIEFLAAYQAAGLTTRLPLAGSGFFAEGAALAGHGERAAGVRTALGWAAEPDHPVRVARGDAMAALGYDTGQLLGRAIEQAGHPREWAQAALDLSFSGVRGELHFDPTTGVVTAAPILREVRRAGGTLQNLALARLPRPALTQPLARPESAWLNPYLSV